MKGRPLTKYRNNSPPRMDSSGKTKEKETKWDMQLLKETMQEHWGGRNRALMSEKGMLREASLNKSIVYVSFEFKGLKPQ